MLAVAMESVVKLLAFANVGISVIFVLFDGPSDLLALASDNLFVTSAHSYETPISRWLMLIALSAFAIIMLPRQFQVTVVKNRTAREMRMAAYLLPLCLIAINIFVLPVAMAGLIYFGGTGNADLCVLLLPLESQIPLISLSAFVGGFSAATAMMIVASVALSIMVSNDIVMPVLLRRKPRWRSVHRADFTKTLLRVRRTSITWC